MLFLGVVIFETVVGNAIDLSASFAWSWDEGNNCGPRPQGPAYPSPPTNSTGSYIEPLPCDIFDENKYFFDYSCKAPCQMDKNKMITLTCTCFFKVGPIKQVIPCKWEYNDGEECPDVPVEEQFDWECDPREQKCPQFPEESSSEIIATDADLPANKPDNSTLSSIDELPLTNMPGNGMPQFPVPGQPQNWTSVYQVPNGANPFWQVPMPGMNGAFGMPYGYGQPIIISPVMTQNLGDVSATTNDAPAENGEPASSDDDSTNSEATTTVQTLADPQTAATDLQTQLEMAESKERLRSLKSQLKAAEHSLDREKEKYNTMLAEAKQGFQRERLEFSRERDEMRKMYEEALIAKENARQETVRQLDKMHELLGEKLKSGEVTSMNKPTDGHDARKRHLTDDDDTSKFFNVRKRRTPVR